MFCKACSAPLHDDEKICGECGTFIDRVPPRQTAPAERVDVSEGALALAVEAAPEPEAVSLPEDAARCPVHPDRIADRICDRCGRFVCVTCEPRFEDGQARCPQCIAREEGESYERIGGWLWLPTISFTLKPVVYALTLGLGFSIQMDGLWESSQATSLTMMAAMVLVLLPFSVFTVVQMYQRRRVFPALAVTWYLLEFALALVSAGLSDSDEGRAGNWVRPLIAAAIWIPYFLYSKRVARTFVR